MFKKGKNMTSEVARFRWHWVCHIAAKGQLELEN